jgi:hypothetical protein
MRGTVMTSDDAQPRQPGDDARDAAHKARRRWADEVVQALAERRLSTNAAAREINISPGRLQAWLHQDVEPNPRVMRDLARVIRRSHVHLLQLLEWLPPEMSDAPLRLEATEKLNDAISEARRWLRGATRAAGLRGGNQVAGALLDASRDWGVTMRNTVRGQRYPSRYAMRVAFHPLVDPPGPPDEATTAHDRATIEHLVYDTMLRTAAQWVPPERVVDRDWAKRPDLVMNVPSLCASRPRGGRPNLLVPPSIVVVGIPLAGSQEVAALLADLLDWAYLDVRALAAEQFELESDAAAPVVERAEVSAARRLLEDPTGLARQTVWSYSGPRPILQSFRQLGSELPLVILLRAPDSLLSHVTEQFAQRNDPDTDLVEAAQNLVRRTMEQQRGPRTRLILDVPDLPLGAERATPRGTTPANPRPDLGSTSEVDDVFDVYVELAFSAAAWLHEQHGAPDLAKAAGVLGELWRSRT